MIHVTSSYLEGDYPGCKPGESFTVQGKVYTVESIVPIHGNNMMKNHGWTHDITITSGKKIYRGSIHRNRDFWVLKED